MEEWLQAVSVVGFPIAMCVWFMRRDERIATLIDNNTAALQRVADVISKCKKPEAST